MTLRFGNLYVGGVYHVFNRGVDKRKIFMDKEDEERFVDYLFVINTSNNIGSYRDRVHTQEDREQKNDALVEIIAYTLQGNHFHMLLQQKQENGISRYMHKLATGYTNYFNNKHKRSGALFQGKYKYIEVGHDAQIMRLICYINKNELVHKHRSPTPGRSSRSWFVELDGPEYINAWRSMFRDYVQTEQEVIDSVLRDRRMDMSDSELLE